MKIIGGTFGTSGSAYFSSDGYLVVDGAKMENYQPGDLSLIDARVDSEKRWSVLSLLGGLLLITPLLTLFFNLVGFIVGLVLTFVFSKYTSKVDLVDIAFKDGNKVSLDCTPRQVKKLVAFKG
ncbi:hypothetical protein [Thiomicrorhabdus lithotrophica]|uniref:Uncharacterized protein n=1 Tax=Thiomicrorhabdus lithotrophica TaxID=2949997 RepID=A0ABY8C8D8_9GAMM|nr:hypothetical protein [Thiomicrorhabdus lithotrophica]WEJ62179.1 hypothetical protein NR989_09175 [Thiomicrorhabdus lithotrophica]